MLKLLWILFFLSACSGSFESDFREIDNTGRELTVSITSPEDTLFTGDESALIKGTAYDLYQIRSVVIQNNQNAPTLATAKWKDYRDWEKSINLEDGTNQVCAEVENDTGGKRKTCIRIEKRIRTKASLPLEITDGIKAPSCTAVEAKIYCLGGTLPDLSGYSEMIIFNTVSNEWEAPVVLQVGSVSEPRQYAVLAAFESKVYVVGGTKNQNYAVQNLVYDTVSGIWNYFPVLNQPRGGHQLAVVNNSLYAVGGVFINLANSDISFLTSVEKYDFSNPGSGWQIAAPMQSPRAGFHLWVKTSGQIVVSGGFTTDSRILSSSESYNEIEGWSAFPSIQTPRFWGCGFNLSDSLYLFGGLDFEGNLLSVEKYYSDSEGWEKAGVETSSLKEAGCASIGKSLYFVGGVDASGNYSKKVLEYRF
ncbi:MAG: hypothetical protein A2Y41_09735 [Spirochaetes bacterium GWB1_36_13]|nr:MAG: hypothetical protein A2Y41_09735 [Spirochaetes bacterium GWB1_36_13]